MIQALASWWRYRNEPEPTKLAPELLGRFGFPIRRVHGKHAIAEWQRLRDLGCAYPLLLGDDDSAEHLIETRDFANEDGSAHDPFASISAASTIDVPRWFAETARDLASDSAEWKSGEPGERDTQGTSSVDTNPRGLSDAEIGRARAVFTVPRTILVRGWVRGLFLAEIPNCLPWQAPAFVGNGGWNEYPANDVTVAIAKSWFDRFGAEPVAITHDVMEFVVPQPVRSRAEAFALAREQYLFCPDIIDQGVGSLSALADLLQGQRSWYFWWD